MHCLLCLLCKYQTYFLQSPTLTSTYVCRPSVYHLPCVFCCPFMTVKAAKNCSCLCVTALAMRVRLSFGVDTGATGRAQNPVHRVNLVPKITLPSEAGAQICQRLCGNGADQQWVSDCPVRSDGGWRDLIAELQVEDGEVRVRPNIAKLRMHGQIWIACYY